MPKSRRIIVEISYDETPIITKKIVEQCLTSKTHFSNVAYEVRLIDDTDIIDALKQVEQMRAFARDNWEWAERLQYVILDAEEFIKSQNYDPHGVTAYVREQYNRRLKESFSSCNWCGGHVFLVSKPPDFKPVTTVDHDNWCVFKE